jgi:hypothetical protein
MESAVAAGGTGVTFAMADSIKPSRKDAYTKDKSRRNKKRNEDVPDEVTVKS